MGGTSRQLATSCWRRRVSAADFYGSAAPRPGPRTAPAVGLALGVVAAALAIRLPGDGTTAALVLAGLDLAGLARAAAPPAAPVSGSGITAALVLAGALIPFLVNARFGLLGVSFNDDANRHLLAIECLRTRGEVPSSVFGLLSDRAARADGGGGGGDRRARRSGARRPAHRRSRCSRPSARCRCSARGRDGPARRRRRQRNGLPGGRVLRLRGVQGDADGAARARLRGHPAPGRATAVRPRSPSPRSRPAASTPTATPGLAWPLGALALWAALELVTRAPGAPAGGARPPRAAPRPPARCCCSCCLPGACVTGVAVRVRPPLAGRHRRDHGDEPGYTNERAVAGRGARRVAVRRLPARPGRGAARLAGRAVGVARSRLRRRLVAPPARARAPRRRSRPPRCSTAYFRVTQSPWISAKALVILSPLAVATGARALLAPRVPVWRAVLATGFVAAAAGSSLLHLRTARWSRRVTASELRGARAARSREDRVLLLTARRLRAWRLLRRDVVAAGRQRPGPAREALRDGDPVDFDSPHSRADLADEPLVITSGPPTRARRRPAAAWCGGRLVPAVAARRRPPPRATLDEGPAPGAPLDCATTRRARARRARRPRVVTPAPVEARAAAHAPRRRQWHGDARAAARPLGPLAAVPQPARARRCAARVGSSVAAEPRPPRLVLAGRALARSTGGGHGPDHVA